MFMRSRSFLIGAFFVAVMLTLRADPPQGGDTQFPLLRQSTESRQVIPSEQVKPLMRKKLEHAKQILEGLALERHEQIAKHAKAMKSLSFQAGWKVVQTEHYAEQSRDFQRLCDSIETAAKNEDTNRAALAYVGLTVRCIECHNYLRENKIILTSKKEPLDLTEYLQKEIE